MKHPLAEHIGKLATKLGLDLDAQTMVVVSAEGPQPGLVGLYGNVAGFASMLREACDTATELARPDGCATCAAAWDAIQLAKLALTNLPAGPCQ